jgi:DNA repair protein RadC
MKQWRHPGGKLLALGADKLTDAELLAILISIGIKNKSAEKIAEELLNRVC